MVNLRKSLCLLLALGIMTAYGQGSFRQAKQQNAKPQEAQKTQEKAQEPVQPKQVNVEDKKEEKSLLSYDDNYIMQIGAGNY